MTINLIKTYYFNSRPCPICYVYWCLVE